MSTMKSSLVMAVVAMVAAGCGGGGPGGRNDSGMNPDGSPDDGGPVELCGNGQLDEGEPCDGDLLDSASCESLGYTGGSISCLADCRGRNETECTVDPVMQGTTPASPVAITDNGYDGTIASMTCLDVVIPEGTRGYVNNTAFSVQLTMDHTFVGDLVLKLVAPSGHVSTLMHRPGLTSPMDNGDLSGGNGADLVSTHPVTFARGIGGFMSEALGTNLTAAQAPCRDNIYCNYVGVSTVGPDEIQREPVAGTWRVCVGDAASGDTGTVTSVALDLGATTVPEDRSEGGEVLTTAIADGAFDGTVASMTCRPFDFTDLDSALDVLSFDVQFGVTHPNVGDLVFALVDPAGEPHALAVRPGMNEGADGSGSGVGAVANLTTSPRVAIHVGGLVAYPSAETMGEGIATEDIVCAPDSSCVFSSNSGALPWASAETLLGGPASGSYQVCVGDAREGDMGTFDYAVHSIQLQP